MSLLSTSYVKRLEEEGGSDVKRYQMEKKHVLLNSYNVKNEGDGNDIITFESDLLEWMSIDDNAKKCWAIKGDDKVNLYYLVKTPGYDKKYSLYPKGKYNDKYSGYKGSGEYNLGFGITSLDNFVNNKKDDKFIVLRLKDEIIDNILNVNTSIIWPDTNKEENLVSDNETKIDVILSNTEYTDKVILNINLYDKDGLIEYKFDKDNINSDYIKIDKAIDYNLNFDISENGIYNIYVKDSFGNEVKKTIEINNIDKELPVINNLYYNEGLIIVEADDLKSGLSDYAYSFDNCITWIKESEFEVKTSGKYVVCVKDRIGNLIKDTIDVNIENPSNSTQKNNFNYFYIIYIIIVFIIIVLLIIYLYTKKRGNYNV